MSKDELYMQRCLHLAVLGSGKVTPNPLVGAVIVHQNKIIGEGYHQKYGEAHAEVNAVNSVTDHSLLSESTIYVSLEPCAHFGKTPPCADLLVQHRFKRVVIGCTDSFSEVSGKGIQRLKDAGIEMTVGVLEKECRHVNRYFFTFHEKRRPFIHLKWAQTTNGLIDNSQGKNGEISWISAPETQVKTHLLRANVQAILVGKNTVLSDNPSLTVRAVDGANPTRIILDSHLSLSREYQVFDQRAPTFIFNLERDFTEASIIGVKLEKMTPECILESLQKMDIQSVLVEGGKSTLTSFIQADLWDEGMVIVGQHSFDAGTSAPKITATPSSSERFFGDHIHTYINQ